MQKIFSLVMRITACFLAFLCATAYAQQQTASMPNSIRQSMQALGELELYMVDMEQGKQSWKCSTPVNISRNAGYDNQPAFTPDNRSVLYVSMRESAQTDVYRYNIKDSSTVRLTNTPESEYTPSIMPADGKSIVVVRVEQDSTQRLWRFDADGSRPMLLLDSVRRVGYYGWLGASYMGLFVLGQVRGEAYSLRITPFDAENPHGTELPKPDSIQSNIGRCIRRVPSILSGSQNAASFVDKSNDSVWMIKRVNVRNRIVSQICPALPGAEDYAWTRNGTLIMGRGLELFARNPRKDNAWKKIADFTPTLTNGYIKRLTLSPDEKRLVFVVQEKP